MKTSEEIKPYQFEPLRGSVSEDDGWTDCDSDDSEEEEADHMLERTDLEAEVWCKCDNCQRKMVSIECICCTELDETKFLLEKDGLSKTLILYLKINMHSKLYRRFLNVIFIIYLFVYRMHHRTRIF